MCGGRVKNPAANNQERNRKIMRYDNFFSDETKKVFESGDFSNTDNAV